MRCSNGVSPETGGLRDLLRDLAGLTALPVILSSGDRQRIAEGLVEAVARILDPYFVYLCVDEPGGLCAMEVVHWRSRPSLPGATWLLHQAIAPFLATDAPISCELSLPASLAAEPLQAVVCPLGYVHVFGALVVASEDPGFPSEEDRLLVGVAANQAAGVLQRLHADLAVRRQNERLRLLWTAAATLLSSDNADDIVRGLFARVGPKLGLDVYFNHLIDETGDRLRLESGSGLSEKDKRQLAQLELGTGLCGTVALSRQPSALSYLQVSEDPRAQLLKAIGLRSCTCNPLLAGDRFLGTLTFASRTRDELDGEELEFLQTVSHYVTLAFERLRLINQLRDRDRRKDEFLATLAHELRNPLAPIRNSLELIRRAPDERGMVDHALALMDRQLRHLVRLVDDLLDVSRITRGNLRLRKETVQLVNVIRTAAEGSRPFIDAGAHTLSISLPAEPVFLNADPTRLGQVFANLLNNAAKYTDKGGRIQLRAERLAPGAPPFQNSKSGGTMVTIRDSGIGIAPENLPGLFEMFSQVEPALARSQGGLGIGLALVKGLVELHGGHVEARSAGIGQGSEFIVFLPTIETTPPARPANVRETALSPSHFRVLVVDDNRDAADSLSTMLRLGGHETKTAYDGFEAVQAAGTFRPDIVLLDIGLPRLNGYEAARQIRQEPWGKNMVVVALTGWGQEEDKRKALEAGCDHHLTKPVDPAELERLLPIFAAESAAHST